MVLNVFGREIPLYGLLLYAGVTVAAVVAIFLCRKRKFDVWELVGISAIALVGALIGSKLLFLAVSMRQIIEERIPLMAVVKGGFVFYGGLLGALAAILLYAKRFKMDPWEFLDIFAVPLPLGHAFGRIGCYFGGCCYGFAYDGPGHIVYHTTANLNTPLETPLFPIQLVSAAGLFLLFVALLIVFLKAPQEKGRAAKVYLFAYPTLRFFVEFLRGDRERGLFLGLSTSQWVSLLIVSVTAFLLLRKKKKTAYPQTE